ncbi:MULTISPECIES: hypothetical protein [unclassified Ruminococcus]|uniref:hypothetical protein n=1 Tax=unclassified Ruminococcus TaxID=2608920 RepID=UPI00210B32F1|nr:MULTISPECIES: hypothetical protein [unclassified Ruminococcus]MCQ4021519.1 hypothetical protein [Ruminococcus sp. zg-924]MCQ4113964.1 hypothetical protein [Ruminococcus sp. zg-921]
MKKINKLGLIAICVIVLSVLATGTSFSWLARPGSTPKQGDALGFTGSAVIKSSGCTATTYLAELNNGIIEPEKTAVTTSTSITVDAGKCKYFRTVVQNGSAKNNIMLGGLQLSNGTNLNVICLSPLKTQAAYSSGVAITQHLTIDAGGKMNIDWYLYNSGSSAKTITMSALPKVLYYN